MEQKETAMVTESKPEVGNVIESNCEMETMNAVQIAGMTEKMVYQEISALGAEYLNTALQCI